MAIFFCFVSSYFGNTRCAVCILYIWMTVKNRSRHVGTLSLKLSVMKSRLSIYQTLYWFPNWQTRSCGSICMRTCRMISFSLKNSSGNTDTLNTLQEILGLNEIAWGYKETGRVMFPKVASTELSTSLLQGTAFIRIHSYILVPITFCYIPRV